MYIYICMYIYGVPWCLSGKESTCQCRRRRFDSWVGKMPWRRKWQPIPVFLLGKSHGQRSWWAAVHGVARVRHDLATKQQQHAYTHTHTHSVGSVPLENPKTLAKFHLQVQTGPFQRSPQQDPSHCGLRMPLSF